MFLMELRESKMNLFRVEIYKMLHRKDFWFTHLFLVVIPLLFSILLRGNNKMINVNGGMNIGGGFFTVFIMEFLVTVFAIKILVCILATGLWAEEFKSGTMNYLIVKGKSRNMIFFAKLTALYTATVSYVINIWLISALAYKLIAHTSVYYSKDYFSVVGNKLWIYLGLNIVYLFVVGAVAMLLSQRLGNSMVLLFMIVIMIFARILEKNDMWTNYLPGYVVKSEVVFLENTTVYTYCFNFFVMVIYVLILTTATFIMFRRRRNI